MPVLNGALSFQKFTNARYKVNATAVVWEDNPDFFVTQNFQMPPNLAPEELLGLILYEREGDIGSSFCIISAQYHEEYPDEVIKLKTGVATPWVIYYSNKTGKTVMDKSKIPDILAPT